MENESELSGGTAASSGMPSSVRLIQIILGLCAFGALLGSGILLRVALAASHPIVFLLYAMLGGMPIWIIIAMNKRRRWTRWAIVSYLVIAALMFPLLLNAGIAAEIFPPLVPSPYSAGAALFEKVRLIGLLLLAFIFPFNPKAKQFLAYPPKAAPAESGERPVTDS